MADIGFIGLGVMGLPMACNLVRRGLTVLGYDVMPQQIEALVRAGGERAESLAAVGEQCATIITMLPTDADIEQTIFQPGGLAGSMVAGGLLIDMSTVSPFTSQRVASGLHEKQIRVLDAPVARSSREAVTGQLLIMVGGDEHDYERALPVLQSMGSDIFYCGANGMGTAMKLVNNLLNETILMATSEAFVTGVKIGLQPDVIFRVLSQTNANNGHLQRTFTQKTFRGDFDPGFKVRLGHKDLGLAVQMANRLGVPVIIGGAAYQAAALALASGKADLDLSAFIQVLEELAGVRVRTEKVAGPTGWTQAGAHADHTQTEDQ